MFEEIRKQRSLIDGSIVETDDEYLSEIIIGINPFLVPLDISSPRLLLFRIELFIQSFRSNYSASLLFSFFFFSCRKKICKQQTRIDGAGYDRIVKIGKIRRVTRSFVSLSLESKFRQYYGIKCLFFFYLYDRWATLW